METYVKLKDVLVFFMINEVLKTIEFIALTKLSQALCFVFVFVTTIRRADRGQLSLRAIYSCNNNNEPFFYYLLFS